MDRDQKVDMVREGCLRETGCRRQGMDRDKKWGETGCGGEMGHGDVRQGGCWAERVQPAEFPRGPPFFLPMSCLF